MPWLSVIELNPSDRGKSEADQSCLRFYVLGFHRLVRIIRDLIVKKYLGADLTLPITYLLLFIIILIAVFEGHKLGIFLIPLLVHVHRFIVYLGVMFTRKYWILRFNF